MNYRYRVVNALRMAAQLLSKSSTALGTFYRLTRSRLGLAKAITVTDQHYHEQVVKNLKKKAQALGFDLITQSFITDKIS